MSDEHTKPAAWVRFEDDVFRHVEESLKRGHLCVNPQRASAYRKRRYWSEPRKSEIEFEIEIEALDLGAIEPSLVWVWECKDHSTSGRKVEASEIESLNDKIDQLGRARWKASIVTTHGFQQGAIERAKACGIGVFVLNKVLERMVQYSRGCSEAWDETLVAVSGISPSGERFPPDCRFADVFRRCFADMMAVHNMRQARIAQRVLICENEDASAWHVEDGVPCPAEFVG